MVRTFFVAILFMVVQVPSTPVATPASDVCGDLQVYFAELDSLIFTDMANITADPEWQAAMERTSRKIDATEAGILGLNNQDFEPMIALYEAPANVLLDYPEEDIPAVAEGFHASALRYWITMPGMMRAIGGGGAFAGFLFTEDLDIASMDNLRGISKMTVACPEVISEQSAAANAASWESFVSISDDLAPANEREVPAGFAYSIMTNPSSDLVNELQGWQIDPVRQAVVASGIRIW